MIRYSFLNLMLALTLCALATPGGAANDGLITKSSHYSAKETVERFEAAEQDDEL